MKSSARWDDILTDTDREVIRRAGYGRPRGLGNRPVLMLIDPQYNYCGADLPILDQLNEWPSGVGESAWRATTGIRRVPRFAARQAQTPVISTRQVQKTSGIRRLRGQGEPRWHQLPGGRRRHSR